MSTSTLAAEVPRLDAPLDPLLLQRRYHAWMARHMPSGADLYRERLAALRLAYQPLITFVMPVYNTPPEMLRRMLACIAQQTYPRWELCIADDGSAEPWLARYLSALAARDPRVRFQRRPVNGGIAAATNTAIAMATGEFVAFVDHDDEIDPRLLFSVVQHLNAHPSTDVVHFDFDHILTNGTRLLPAFEPGWSPELLLALPYIVHMIVRRSCLAATGDIRSECDGGQDYDLALRVSEVTQEIHHLPQVMYHWRIWPGSAASSSAAKPYAFEARKRAVRDTIQRRGLAARCVEHRCADLHRVLFDVIGDPLISVIVPVATGASADTIAGQVQRLAQASAYRRFEIILTGSHTVVAATVERIDLPASVPVRIAVSDPGDLGASVNHGAAAANGDHLLLLSADMEAVDEQWMSALLEYSQLDAIGAVGAHISKPSGVLVHAGVHIPRGLPVAARRDLVLHSTQMREVLSVANFSAVSAACLMTRRDVFTAAGGFRSSADVGFADVDYCLRVRASGRRIVFTPFARLQALAPLPMFPAEGNEAFRRRWSGVVDPYYNPNLAPDGSFLTTED